MKPCMFLMSLVLMSSMFSCNHRGTPTSATAPENAGTVVPLKAPDTTLIQGNNRFALELYSYIRSGEKNVFFSPYSISAALAMTYAGARGESEKQMSSVLHFKADQQRFHPEYRDLLVYIDGLNQGDSLMLSTANGLFVQKEFAFLDTYINLVKSYYGAGLQMVDFKNELEKARVTINDWVAGKTHDRIQNLIVQGMMNEMARLVLVNAIYFNGSWADRFDVKQTLTQPFNTAPEKFVDVPFMRKQAEYRYYRGDQMQMVEIPYVDSTLSMVILLPTDLASMDKLEKSLNASQYKAWLLQMSMTKVNLSIPRFKTTAEFELSDVLKKMGMPHPFSMSADLSGMTGKKDLMIDKVIHKAFVEVSEKGTEAAAATAVVIRVKSLPVVEEFKANHPFIFMIKENKYDNILFMGRMNNPK